MKLNNEFKLCHRQAGATTWMLDHLIDSIKKGEPVSIVVCANRRHCKILFNDVLKMLEANNIDIHCDKFLQIIVANYSKIGFISAEHFLQIPFDFIDGLYIDHAAIDLGYINKNDLDRIYNFYNLEE